jgi:hypothetical protein
MVRTFNKLVKSQYGWWFDNFLCNWGIIQDV